MGHHLLKIPNHLSYFHFHLDLLIKHHFFVGTLIIFCLFFPIFLGCLNPLQNKADHKHSYFDSNFIIKQIFEFFAKILLDLKEFTIRKKV